MAKVKDDTIPVAAVTSAEETIVALFAAVAKRQFSMKDAETRLHAFFDSLPEDKQQEARDKARVWGMYLHSIAEAFLQELTIAGAKR